MASQLLRLDTETLIRLFKGQLMTGRLVCKRFMRDFSMNPMVINVSIVCDGRLIDVVVPADGSLENQKKVLLEKMCRARGIIHTGVKQDLIDRLRSYRAEQDVEAEEMRSRWRRKFSDTVSAFPRMLGTRLHLRLYDFQNENAKLSARQRKQLEQAAHGVLLGELEHISNVIEIDSKLVIEFIEEGLS